MSLPASAIAYLDALAGLGTVASTRALAETMGDTVRQARRRVELLEATGLVEVVDRRGVRPTALGLVARVGR